MNWAVAEGRYTERLTHDLLRRNKILHCKIYR